MMVQLPLTSLLLLALVLPSLIYAKSATVSVLNGSATLEMSVSPDDATISDKLTVKVNLTSTTRDVHVVSAQIDKMQNLHPTVSTADTDIRFKYDQSENREVSIWDASSFIIFTMTLDWPVDMDFHREYILVTISITFDDKQITVTNNVLDNRVKIGFLPLYHQCHPEEGCDLTIEINHFTESQPFNVTVELFNSSGSSVNQSTLSVKGDSRHLQRITAPNLGSYHVTLSVAKGLQSRVYWSNPDLDIQVVPNEVQSLKAELTKLQRMYVHLVDIYDQLYDEFESFKNSSALKELACKDGDCGDYGTCERGKCECEYPWIYGGNYCERHIACESSPCGSRGSCEEPAVIEDMYECKCHHEHVTGKNCTECEGGNVYCSDSGNCSVTVEGAPQCTCYKGFEGEYCQKCDSNHTGDKCQFKKCKGKGEESRCGGHGDCYYPVQGSTNETQCYCYHGFHGENCDDNSTTTQPVSSTTPTPLPPETSTSPAASDADTSSQESTEQEEHATSSPYPSNTLLYGGLIVFIAFLVVCVAAYLAYHNKDKILELFGRKKESVVEMAMRSRTKSKGYKKLPTSIHDTLTHED